MSSIGFFGIIGILVLYIARLFHDAYLAKILVNKKKLIEVLDEKQSAVNTESTEQLVEESNRRYNDYISSFTGKRPRKDS